MAGEEAEWLIQYDGWRELTASRSIRRLMSDA
jgi:hypothetical protein